MDVRVRQNGLRGFLLGLAVGITGALLLGLVLVYILNAAGVLVVNLPAVSHAWLEWIYSNLRLSIIPFTITLLLYGYALARLQRLVAAAHASVDEVAHAEHLLDIWVNLFFGVGVIWTAIGIRSALITALGGLDPEQAASLGEFTILQRLVDGGILLALSTTIVGGVGGYLLRVIKAMTVGARLQSYYDAIARSQTDEIAGTLHRIEQQLRRADMVDIKRTLANNTPERSQ